MIEKRFLILGSGGSGKSTFGSKLAQKLGLPLIHLDQHYFQPSWQEPDKECWREYVMHLAGQSNWIIEGNCGATIDVRVQKATDIIYLKIHPLICIWRVLKRYLPWSSPRIGMANECPERLDMRFLFRLWTFQRDQMTRDLKAIQAFAPNARLHIIKNSQSLIRFLQWEV